MPKWAGKLLPDQVEIGAKNWPRGLLFDLDGTLIESVPDIAASVNELVQKEALAPFAVKDVRSMIGHGIAKLVERAFAARAIQLDGENLVAMTERMMAIYKDRLVEETVLLPGAYACLEANAKARSKLAVVTNKPEGFSRRILEHFGLDKLVSVVVGGDTGPVRKPAPDMLLYAAKLLDIAVSDALMIGDSPADIDAAKAASMRSVAVRGGYTNVPVEDLGADVVIDDLSQLPGAVETIRNI